MELADKTSSDIGISVCFIAYNQEDYVEQALNSILEQKIEIPIEIVIGDDCSTDRTSSIIKSIKDRHSNNIKILPRPANLGALKNAIDTQKNCSGKYIAFLEGDDYWSDSYKLQKQYDYMEEHLDCSMCFTKAIEFFDDDIGRFQCELAPPILKPYYTIVDTFSYNFIPTCTVLYRNGLISYFPDWMLTLKQADWSLYALLSSYGHFGYIDAITASRRVHRRGIWSGQPRELQLKSHLLSLTYFENVLNSAFTFDLNQAIVLYEFKLIVEYERLGKKAYAIRSALPYLRHFSTNRLIKKHDFIKLLIKFLFPVSFTNRFRRRKMNSDRT